MTIYEIKIAIDIDQRRRKKKWKNKIKFKWIVQWKKMSVRNDEYAFFALMKFQKQIYIYL